MRKCISTLISTEPDESFNWLLNMQRPGVSVINQSCPDKEMWHFIYKYMFCVGYSRANKFHPGPHQHFGCPQRASCNFKTI